MKPRNKNAIWYGFGVFASLAAAFSTSGESERLQPGDPLSFALAAFWAFFLTVLYLVYGSVSTRIRPLNFDHIPHFAPLIAGILYAPIIFGVVSLLASLIDVVPEPIRDDSWAVGLGVILLLLPIFCFEINRIKMELFPHCVRALIAPSNRMAQFER